MPFEGRWKGYEIALLISWKLPKQCFQAYVKIQSPSNNTIHSRVALLHWWPFYTPMSSFSPQRKNPSLYISLYRCSLLTGVAEGTTGIILATSLFLVQGHLLRWAQLATTESNPSHANWRHENSPSVQPVSSFKECSPCMTEGRKLLAGHPAQPPHSRTNYSSLLWP